MIEYCCGDDNRNDIDHTRTLAYATHDPWDGRVFAVVTGGGHVEPIWWQGPKGVEACFPADRASLPATLHFSGDLGTIGLFAERNGIALTEQWKVGKATLAEIASGKEEKGRVADAWQEKARLHFGHDVLHTLYRNAALWQAFDPCVDTAVILLEGHFEAMTTRSPEQAATPSARGWRRHVGGPHLVILIHEMEIATAFCTDEQMAAVADAAQRPLEGAGGA